MFILLLLFYYWLLVSASKGLHQANIYKNLKVLVHIVKGKGKVHPCTGTEALYRPYGPQGE